MPAVLVAAGIAVLSLMESNQMPRTSLNDKLVHGLMYAILGFCTMFGLWTNGRRTWHWWLAAMCGCTAYGLLMEILQRFCTLTRTAEMADLLADWIGAVLGVILFVIVCWIHRSFIGASSKAHGD